MPMTPYFLRVVCICLGFGCAQPGLTQTSRVNDSGHALPDADGGGPGVVVHARLPASVLTVRAHVAPTCLMTVAIEDAPSIDCTRGIDWHAVVGGDVPVGRQKGSASIAAELPSGACGAGTPASSCLIVEF